MADKVVCNNTNERYLIKISGILLHSLKIKETFEVINVCLKIYDYYKQ